MVEVEKALWENGNNELCLRQIRKSPGGGVTCHLRRACLIQKRGWRGPWRQRAGVKVLRMSRIPCGIFRKWGSSESSKWREEVTKTDETKKDCLWPGHSGPLHLPIVSRGCRATRLGGEVLQML